MLALLSVTVFVIGLPDRLSDYRLLWFTQDIPPTEVIAAGMDSLGISPRLYAFFGVSMLVFRAVVFYLAGAVVFWRRSAEPMALLVAILLIALPVGDEDPALLRAMAAEAPVRAAAITLIEVIGFILALWVLFLFPDGRFRPGWTKAVAVVWLSVGIGALYFPGTPIDMSGWPQLLSLSLIPLAFLSGVGAQVWRYRRISGPVERQQTKWFALGMAIIMGEFAFTTWLTAFSRLHWPENSPRGVVIADLLLHTVHNLAFLAFPTTLAIAVLRYRLWDIDHLLNRALVYGSLSTLLVLFYFGAVTAMQELLRAAVGQTSDAAIALSTLGMAVIFQPLRRRLQTTIDRRFFRRRYDAAQTLDAFGVALRNETDLVRIQARLLTTVNETIQPAHAWLWLRAPDPEPTVSGRPTAGGSS